jgi:nucleoside-diphosphate-sugar epimerase
VHSVVREDLDRILNAPLAWERLAGRTVLVTGAGGFLAAWIAFVLARHNDLRPDQACRVVAMVRSRQRASARLGPLMGRRDFLLVEQDVADAPPPDFLDGAPADFIIHAASAAAPKTFLADPTGVIRANVLGTSHLLDLARARGCEGLLFLSSGEVHGETGAATLSETVFGYMDPATVRACYGESKRAAEALLVAHSAQFGTETRIVRPLHTYGPMIDLEDGRVFSDFVGDILARRDIVLKSDGSARRPFLYVADAMTGFFKVLFEGARATPYIVGADNTFVSIAELARILTQEAFPELGLGARFGPPSDLSSPITGSPPDISRLRGLGWAPTTGLVEGFRRTVASFSADRKDGE